MLKLCAVAIAVSIAPLFVWLMVPTLMFLALVALFMVPLGALMVATARPRSAIPAPVTSAARALPEPERTSEPNLRPSYFAS